MIFNIFKYEDSVNSRDQSLACYIFKVSNSGKTEMLKFNKKNSTFKGAIQESGNRKQGFNLQRGCKKPFNIMKASYRPPLFQCQYL